MAAITYKTDQNTGEKNESKDVDLHLMHRNNPKYHTLLGQDQRANRNENTIKMSSASAAVNSFKNVENKVVIANMSKLEFSQPQISQIQDCIRNLNIDLTYFMPLQMAFIKADKNQNGMVTVKKLIKRLHAFDTTLPAAALKFFLTVMYQKKDEEEQIDLDECLNADAHLSFSKL